jgi:hypothetical protein
MDESAFWKIIDRAHAEGEVDLAARVDSLGTQLSNMSTTEVQSFQSHYNAAIKCAYQWELWGAASIINGKNSLDSFLFFIDWLISEGRETYQRALGSPDSLADFLPIAYAENELFGYVALCVFESKAANSMVLNPTAAACPPLGEPWIKEDLSLLFPRLSNVYQQWGWLQRIRRNPVMSNGHRALSESSHRFPYSAGFQFE